MIIRYGLCGIWLFLFAIFSVKESRGQSELGQVKCICIDPGHGGKDPGALGVKSYEKNIVLSVALKLGKMIREAYPDVKVVYTRDKDVFIDLDKRGKIANNHKADLFVSIHINSNDSKSPKGLETYVLGLHRSKENLAVAMKENSVIKYEKDYSIKYAGFDPNRAESYIIFSLMQNLYLEKSLRLAAFVQEEMVGHTGRADRGVRQAGYLVLKDAAMPAILVEAGFISNPEEERYLCTQNGQHKIASAIFEAIGKYKASVEKDDHLLKPHEEEGRQLAEETTIPAGKISPEESGLFYAVQIASATNRIKNARGLCSGEEVCELASEGRYRYYVARSADLEEVKKRLPQIRSKVRDCFIIAVHEGKIISMAEARKIKND